MTDQSVQQNDQGIQIDPSKGIQGRRVDGPGVTVRFDPPAAPSQSTPIDPSKGIQGRRVDGPGVTVQFGPPAAPAAAPAQPAPVQAIEHQQTVIEDNGEGGITIKVFFRRGGSDYVVQLRRADYIASPAGPGQPSSAGDPG